MILDDDFATLLDERPKEALRVSEAAVKAEPDSADAHYALGLSYEALEREAEMEHEYLEVRRLDALAATSLPMSLEKTVQDEAEAIIRTLPRDLKKRLGSPKIRVERLPTEDLVESRVTPRPSSSFAWVQEKPDDDDSRTLETVILFSYVIQLGCEDEDEVRAEVAELLLEQIGQELGLDDSEIDELIEGYSVE